MELEWIAAFILIMDTINTANLPPTQPTSNRLSQPGTNPCTNALTGRCYPGSSPRCFGWSFRRTTHCGTLGSVVGSGTQHTAKCKAPDWVQNPSSPSSEGADLLAATGSDENQLRLRGVILHCLPTEAPPDGVPIP